MTPAKPKPPRPRLNRDPYLRQIWRVAYLDHDFGKCYAWAATHDAAKLLRAEIIAHYSHDTRYTGPPEVFIGSVLIPIGNRVDLAMWLTQHAAYEPPRHPTTARDA